MKWRFAGKFLLSFAVLLGVWWAIDFAWLYRTAVLQSVQLLSPLVSGWWLDYDRKDLVSAIAFRLGDRQLAMLLQLPALSMGLVPLLSLIVATPGLRPQDTAIRCALGVVLYLLLDVAVVLAYPLIMDRPNVLKDTLGVFTGLMVFVVAPLGLWFALTYSALQSLWQLGPKKR